jgi:hypothetical protein
MHPPFPFPFGLSPGLSPLSLTGIPLQMGGEGGGRFSSLRDEGSWETPGEGFQVWGPEATRIRASVGLAEHAIDGVDDLGQMAKKNLSERQGPVPPASEGGVLRRRFGEVLVVEVLPFRRSACSATPPPYRFPAPLHRKVKGGGNPPSRRYRRGGPIYGGEAVRTPCVATCRVGRLFSAADAFFSRAPLDEVPR